MADLGGPWPVMISFDKRKVDADAPKSATKLFSLMTVSV